MFRDPYNDKTITTRVVIQGIDPESRGRVGPLREYMASYNQEIEDGVVIKEAQRSREEPLSWELTESAAMYRENMKRQEALEIKGAFEDYAPPVSNKASAGASQVETPQFDTESSGTGDTVAGQNPLPQNEFLTDPSFNQLHHLSRILSIDKSTVDLAAGGRWDGIAISYSHVAGLNTSDLHSW